MKNLLIGNGLNLTNYKENSFLEPNEIYDRFIKNLTDYWNVINRLVYQNEMNLEKLIKQLCSKEGIEENAGKVFRYIYHEITLKGEFSWNDSYRLVEILGEIAIKSIFFKEKVFLIPKITDEYINKITTNYDNVYTLNYIEDWDKNENLNYLHGNLKKYINSYCDIGSKVLSNNAEYCKFKTNDYIKIDFKDIIFMPINDIINKYNYIVEGLYPRNNLYPADDLFPYAGRDIYKNLEQLDNIDIFGMSPYGDEAIIDKIKNIKNKNIYVYKLNNNEINKWMSYGIKNCFIDSEEFLNN